MDFLLVEIYFSRFFWGINFYFCCYVSFFIVLFLGLRGCYCYIYYFIGVRRDGKTFIYGMEMEGLEMVRLEIGGVGI